MRNSLNSTSGMAHGRLPFRFTAVVTPPNCPCKPKGGDHGRRMEEEANTRGLSGLDFRFRLDQIPLKRGYLTGAPGVVWKPPNSFRPSGMVTVRALATLLPSLAR